MTAGLKESPLSSVCTVQEWARAYIETEDLNTKLRPESPPRHFAAAQAPLRLVRPGRPAAFVPAPRREKTPKPEAFRDPRIRARAMHAFFHHELQAAELMCWAILAFPDTPEVFRRGLLGICLDEIRHMNFYNDHLSRLGYALGDFPVRDWFGNGCPGVQTPCRLWPLWAWASKAETSIWRPRLQTDLGPRVTL